MSRSSKISLAGAVLVVMAVLYLFLPIYSANVSQFSFSCSVIKMLFKGGFSKASFLQIVEYILPFILLLVTGCFAIGGKFKFKYVVVGLSIATLVSLLWTMFDLTLVKSFVSSLDFGTVNVKNGTGIGLIISIVVLVWAAITTLLAKRIKTF